MRVLFLVIWMLLPIGAVAFHFGVGQDLVKQDETAKLLRESDHFRIKQEWMEAQASLEKALGLVPSDDDGTRRKVRLELCKVQLENQGLPTAHEELKSLMSELDADPAADSSVVDDCRETLANSQYYMTWLMRLEGLTREVWGPEIESAQQNLRLLAQKSAGSSDVEMHTRYLEDLESAVRLARMDLGELQGLPLPSQ